MKKTDTVLRILSAAVEIVNTGGTEALTTRRVAETAGVNAAAVNYHSEPGRTFSFRSSTSPCPIFSTIGR